MPKNTIYPLVGPRYPLFVPVQPAPAKAWREFGRSPKPGIISIGLPRAWSPSTPDLWTPTTYNSGDDGLTNLQTVRVLNAAKRNHD